MPSLPLSPFLPGRILLVDDEPTVRFALTDYFERAGYRVDVAIDSATALRCARAATYDAVLTDLMLEPGNPTGGFDVVEEIHLRSPGAVSVLVTAHASPEVEAEARRRRIDSVVAKPVELRSLLRLTIELLGLKACFR